MTGKGKILRIYASHTDRLNHAPLYEAVVREAERMGMAGASHKLHSEVFWEISQKMPVTVEIVDEAEKIDRLAARLQPMLEAMPKGCLMIAQEADILVMQSGKKSRP